MTEPSTTGRSPEVAQTAPGARGGFRAVQQRLATEVLRKLSLAASADSKEDRDIVCSEVFADITGDLNSAARGSTGTLYTRWYEVLAPYFCANFEAAERLLAACRLLWGQPFTTPTYALLLHQWLLVHPNAGGPGERLKLLNVLVSGARQLFTGDADTGNTAFAPMFSFLVEQVVLSADRARLVSLPATGREAVMAVTASFLPYYLEAPEFVDALERFPAPGLAAGGQAPPPSASGRKEGTDFALDRIVDTLAKEVATEPALFSYLRALAALGRTGTLTRVRTSTRIRLQAELYSLTQPGGPRYATRAVNRQAFGTLDVLFPVGRHVRRAVNAAFRVLHPAEWPWLWWDVARDVTAATAAWLLALWAGLLVLLRRAGH